MKNSNLKLNEKFKNSLDDSQKAKREKICSNYNGELMLNLFISWITEKERFGDTDEYLAKWLIIKLKNKKEISWIKPDNYHLIINLFHLFSEFYDANEQYIQELISDDIYQKKVNNLKNNPDFNYKKISGWQEFMEQDNWTNAKIYLAKMKQFYRIFSENELIEIFKLFFSWEKLMQKIKENDIKLPDGKTPFDVAKNHINEQVLKIISKFNESQLKIINSMFSKYLNYLKTLKNLKNTLDENVESSNNIKDKEKQDLFKALDAVEISGSSRISEWWNEDADYTDAWDVIAPVRDYSKWNMDEDEMVSSDEIDESDTKDKKNNHTDKPRKSKKGKDWQLEMEF